MVKSKIKFELKVIIALLGDKLYSKPQVFLRENCQNSVDAIRMLQLTDRNETNPVVKITVSQNGSKIVFEDWGIGMSNYDIEEYFWNIGGSSKRNKEAIECGVIGKFGVGAFANFGVCESVEVSSWKKGGERVFSKIIKSNLDSGTEDYEISKETNLDHYGTQITTIIQGHKVITENQLKKYLQNYVEYLNEAIFFNGDLLTKNTFPEYKITVEKLLDSGILKIHDGIKIEFKIYFDPHDSKIIALLHPQSSDKKIMGWLSPDSNGLLKVYLNYFLLDANYRTDEVKILNFEGYINSNLLEPNVAREGLEENSKKIINSLLIEVNFAICKAVALNNFLNVFSQIDDYIYSRTHESKYENLLRKTYFPVYGSNEVLRLEELKKYQKQNQTEIFYSEAEEIPSNLKDLAAKKEIFIVRFDKSLSWEKRYYGKRYLEDELKGKEISGFQMEATIVEEQSLSIEMKTIRSGLIEAFHSIYFLKNFKVVLCKTKKEYTIYLEDIKADTRVLVNINSEKFKDLYAYIEDINLKYIVNNYLITPFISESLKNLIPDDILKLTEEISDQVKLEIVEDIYLIKGGDWKGPTANCLNIKSEMFPHLVGFYIRIPDRIRNKLNEIISSCDPPEFYWHHEFLFADIRVKDVVFSIHIKLINLLSTLNGEIAGTAPNKRRFMIYDTGAYLPIPVPPLSDILPFKNHVDLAITLTTHKTK